MAEPKDVQKDFYEQVAPLFGREGSILWRKADDLLTKNPQLATLITPSGASAVDVALASDTQWLARELAVTAQLQAHPEQKPAYEQKLAEALEADRKQRTAGYNADIKVRQKLQDEWLLALDEKTLTPAAKSMRTNIKLEAWKQQQHPKAESSDSYMDIAARQDRPDVMAWMYEQLEARIRARAGDEKSSNEAALKRAIKTSADTELFKGTKLDRETPLIVAARNGKANAVDYLMSQKAFPEVEVVSGGNAAHYAALGNHTNVLEVMDKHGFPLHKENYRGESPLKIAMIAGNKEAVIYLVENAKKKKNIQLQPYLDRALSQAHTPDMAKLIIGLGANPKHKGDKKYSAPLIAIGNIRKSALERWDIEEAKVDTSGLLDVLLEKGADPDMLYKCGNEQQAMRTPLQNAMVSFVESKTLIKLLEKTKNLRTVDGDGETALHYAAGVENLEMLKLLIKKDPELAKISNEKGMTPLLTAVRTSNVEIVRELAKVSDKDAVDNDKENGLHRIVFMLASSDDDTPKESLKEKLEIIRLIRTDRNANVPFSMEGNDPPVTPANYLQQKRDELAERVKNGQQLTPSEIDKLEIMNQAINEILHPQKPQRKAEPKLEDAIKEAVAAVPKPAQVSLATPSEKAKTIPTLPNIPSLNV